MNITTVQAKKRIIILGVKGNIGNALFNELNRKPELFYVSGTSRNEESNNSIITFNPFKDDWDILGKVDVIVNCIGIIQESRGNSFDKIHIGLVKLMLENRQRTNNPLIVQVSALGANGHHAARFLRTKGIADELLLNEENTFVVRPSIVCFPKTLLLNKLKLARSIAKKFHHRILLPKGFADKYVQPVLIDDLVEAIENIIIIRKENYRVINAVGLDKISYREMVCMKADSFEKGIRIIEVNRHLSDLFVKGFIAPLFPSLLDKEQYKLLFDNNIAGIKEIEYILERKPLSSKKFWLKNLIDNYDKL